MWHDAAKWNSDRGGVAPRGRAAGFTVIELLAVMLIITLLVAMVVGVVRYADHASQSAQAKADLERLHVAIGEYEMEEGYVPDVEQFYAEAFRNRKSPPLELKDPWGLRYAYTNLSAAAYALVCAGPDGAVGTADDIHPGD